MDSFLHTDESIIPVSKQSSLLHIYFADKQPVCFGTSYELWDDDYYDDDADQF